MPWWEPTDLFRQLYAAVLAQDSLLQQLNVGMDLLMTQANATQADIDALTAKVTASDDAIQAAVEALRAEIGTMSASGIDVSGLSAAVDKLAADAASDTPAPPATPVDPAPADPAAPPAP